MTIPTDLCFTPATTLARLIRLRKLSPVDIIEAVLTRIDSINPKINAFITVDGEQARDLAKAAETALMQGDSVGLLQGLPVSIKDLEPTSGLRCTYGSKFYENNIAEMDGIITERVKAAGGIILGKTNTPHYGHKDMCDNLIGPPCRNPWNLDRTSGGSSGGAAAAVATGLGPMAHGSDGAGSIRIPAALCGVFGLKPSLGRVPYWPNLDVWAARSHNGPLTRTVADAALMMQAIAGPDSRDPTSVDQPPADYMAAVANPFDALRGLRVAWSGDFGYAPVDPEVKDIAQQAALRFSDLGCPVEAVNPEWDDPRRLAEILWYASYAARHGEKYDQEPDWVEPSLVKMIEAGCRISAEAFVQASIARNEFYHQARQFFETYDLLLTPQMPLGAWGINEEPTEINGTATPSMFDRLNFTFPFNLTGQPAASVPCGFTQEGLPVALQIVGPWHADKLVLQAAAAFEQVQPWTDNKPIV